MLAEQICRYTPVTLQVRGGQQQQQQQQEEESQCLNRRPDFHSVARELLDHLKMFYTFMWT